MDSPEKYDPFRTLPDIACKCGKCGLTFKRNYQNRCRKFAVGCPNHKQFILDRHRDHARDLAAGRVKTPNRGFSSKAVERRSIKFCVSCGGLPHRRPLEGCPECGRDFEPERGITERERHVIQRSGRSR